MEQRRYNHWFWNSAPVYWFAGKVGGLGCWLWRRQHRRTS